jgi:fused signal recognition particle receptor
MNLPTLLFFIQSKEGAWTACAGCTLVLGLVGLVFWRLLACADKQAPQEEAVSQGETAIVSPTPPSRAPEDVVALRGLQSGQWLQNLHRGLTKTRDKWLQGLGTLFTEGRKIDAATLEALSELLYRADVGVRTTASLIDYIRTQRPEGDQVSESEIRAWLRKKTETLFTLVGKPWNHPKEAGSPMVFLIVGVNGVGKTTSIGKLAAHFLAEEKSVLLCAADTYRAAAIEQLQAWGARLDVKVIAHQHGGDPAAVCFDAVQSAMAKKTDVLLIDTAGRLHNKVHLMEELGKIQRTISKAMPEAPHEIWLVLDATTGQNAVAQVQAFQEIVPLSGLVITKLDGTAKGGVLLSIADQFQLPIRFIGVGEKAVDLRPFEPAQFANSLFPA